jgi:hypothetical protein
MRYQGFEFLDENGPYNDWSLLKLSLEHFKSLLRP